MQKRTNEPSWRLEEEEEEALNPQPAVPAQVQHVDDINVADIPAVSAEHATLNLQPSSSMQPVATAFFTEKGEVAFTGLFDRTLKALESVKTTRMGISSGSIDLYAAQQAAESVRVPEGYVLIAEDYLEVMIGPERMDHLRRSCRFPVPQRTELATQACNLSPDGRHSE